MNTKNIITVMLISVISVTLISSVALNNVDAKKNTCKVIELFEDGSSKCSDDNNKKSKECEFYEDNSSSCNDKNNDKSSNEKSSNNNNKKSNKAQIKLVFTDLGNYKGKVKVKLTNNDRDIKLFSETVSLKKDNKETIKFNAKSSKVGDHLTLKVSAPVGSWSFPETFQKSMSDSSVNLEEIGCSNSPSGDCD